MAANRRNNRDLLPIFNKFKDICNSLEIGKILGRGGFGEVRDVRYKNKVMAGKIVIKDNREILDEEKYGLELRGQNLIKINKIITKEFNGVYYDLIIMEKAILRDLGKLTEYFHKHDLLKTLYEPFDEIGGDTYLRFYARQIINALEILDRHYCIHYDIKPENLLITYNLIIKLSDFSLLRKVKSEKTTIPGGTTGYIGPEYYQDKQIESEYARKQDYFALGATLFYIKYGEPLLKYKNEEEKIVNADRIIDLLQKNITFIKSQHLADKDFIEFLCSLISYRPKDRPSFEQIYRNKWLNKNVKYINDIFWAFDIDEEKLIMELQKVDFFIKKKNLNKREDLEIDNLNNEEKELKDNIIKKDKDKDKKSIKCNKKCRFRFKKKNKNSYKILN